MNATDAEILPWPRVSSWREQHVPVLLPEAVCEHGTTCESVGAEEEAEEGERQLSEQLRDPKNDELPWWCTRSCLNYAGDFMAWSLLLLEMTRRFQSELVVVSAKILKEIGRAHV